MLFSRRKAKLRGNTRDSRSTETFGPVFFASFFPLHSTTAVTTDHAGLGLIHSLYIEIGLDFLPLFTPFIDFPDLSHCLGVWARSFFRRTILEPRFIE